MGNQMNSNRPKLYGWKDIAQYLGGCHPATAKRYHKELGLPVRYLNRKPTADPTEIDDWLERQPKKNMLLT
jgi:hypothetical protein